MKNYSEAVVKNLQIKYQNWEEVRYQFKKLKASAKAIYQNEGKVEDGFIDKTLPYQKEVRELINHNPKLLYKTLLEIQFKRHLIYIDGVIEDITLLASILSYIILLSKDAKWSFTCRTTVVREKLFIDISRLGNISLFTISPETEDRC